MNREQRRKAKKQAPRKTPAYRRMTIEERKDALVKNGITPDDLQKAFDKGWKEGFNCATSPVLKTIYAAACLTLHSLEGYGRERCKRFLQALDACVIDTLTSTEAVEKVWDEIGLELDFKESFDRIQEVENHE